MVHLEPALYRMKNDMTISNPLLLQIKQEYPEVFEKCEKAAEVIGEKTGLVANEAEVGYLAMHFGAAKERIDSRKRKKRASCRMRLIKVSRSCQLITRGIGFYLMRRLRKRN